MSCVQTSFMFLHLKLPQTWCGACKRLRGVWAESPALADISKSFVMVNLEDDEEPSADALDYRPDGGYIPRLLFVHPIQGVLRGRACFL